MRPMIKTLLIITSVTVLSLGLIVVLSVEKWAMTEQGRLPPKTAVILHAINHNLVTLDMEPPRVLTSTRVKPRVISEERLIPVSDGHLIPVRIYIPTGEGPYPLILYYHGGAFLEGYGSIETHDNITRQLAIQTESIVVSVGYRLAPHFLFPTAVEDSYDALLWAVAHAEELQADATRIAVAGDSAGGNIATVVALMNRDRGGPPLTAQVLLYPVTTFLEEALPSRDQYASGYYLLSEQVMALARELYAPEEELWHDPYISPLHALDLSNLPPTLIITAEFDPLRDEGEAYAERLADSGTSVLAVRYNGVMHGFISFYEVMHSGKQGFDQTAHFLRQAFDDNLEPQPYQLTVLQPSFNWRDHLEAYGFAAYLLTQKTNAWINMVE